MAVKIEKIVAEDLNLGTGEVEVTMPGGGVAVGTRIGAQTFLAHGFIATGAESQEINDGAAAAIVELPTEEYDGLDEFDTDTYRYLPLTEGIYRVNAHAIVDGPFSVHIYKNSAHVASADGAATRGSVSCDVSMDGNDDTLEMRISTPAPVSGSTTSEVTSARMSAFLIGKVE